jgi:hypothetical protein
VSPSESVLVTLENAGGGAAPALFERAVREIMANIRDRNTEARAPREVTLRFVFLPQDDRETLQVRVSSSVKRAAHKPISKPMYLAERGGEVVMIQYDPRQTELPVDAEGEARAKADVGPLNINPPMRPVRAG